MVRYQITTVETRDNWNIGCWQSTYCTYINLVGVDVLDNKAKHGRWDVM